MDKILFITLATGDRTEENDPFRFDTQKRQQSYLGSFQVLEKTRSCKTPRSSISSSSTN